MELKRLLHDDDAVSPVIGVILMVAITVLLAATAATFFLGFQDQSMGVTPNVALDFDYDRDTTAGSDTLDITVTGGDTVAAKEVSLVVSGAAADSGSPNGRYALEDISGTHGPDSTVSAGQSIRIDGSLGGGVSNLDLRDATVRVVWTAGSGDSGTVLREWTR